MKKNTCTTLEYNQILESLAELAFSKGAKEKIQELKPFLSERQCIEKMKETTDARRLLESIGSPPLGEMKELKKTLDLVEKGAMLIPEQLAGVREFLASCKRMKSYLKRAEMLPVNITTYGVSFNPLEDLQEEIDRSIRNGQVDDSASSRLRDIRRKIENTHSSIKTKLESLLRSQKEKFTDGYLSMRNGRFVLPVKKEYKNQISGSVIDISSTGSTCFIEPTAVKVLQEELGMLQIEEENEVRTILYTLTASIDEHILALEINIECMEVLDFIFAKGKLSLKMGGIPVEISGDRSIRIRQGRHPLLNPEICVPLDFEIGGDIRGVVITGPNTGGKTVALKTVGLLSMMAQSGLHVPVMESSRFSMNSDILCDIGDGQSISENLSTFSAHITNIIDILKSVSEESLVLLDELGSGTDPAEGMGIAISILEELRQRNCLFVATTHYPEIKDFAKNTAQITNARMEFDRETLQPLYKMQIGEAGESCALYIAQRLGFPEHMLRRAHKEAYAERTVDKNSSKISKDLMAGTWEGQLKNGSEITSKDAQKTSQKTTSKILRMEPERTLIKRSERFNIGDSVMVYPKKEIGIVWRKANEQGELGVQIKGVKSEINHKRVQLLTPASELYPEDYDFSIVFDTVENRKARHKMGKGHRPDLEIKY